MIIPGRFIVGSSSRVKSRVQAVVRKFESFLHDERSVRIVDQILFRVPVVLDCITDQPAQERNIRPGATDWQDISWDTALSEIADWTKKTRDASFVEKDANGRTVNRCEGISFIGGCTDTNEFNYLVVKAMRSLGLVYLENQARV